MTAERLEDNHRSVRAVLPHALSCLSKLNAADEQQQNRRTEQPRLIGRHRHAEAAASAAAANPMGRQHAIVAEARQCRHRLAPPSHRASLASTRTLGLIQGFDGRARWFGGSRERLIARSEVLMQRAAELTEFLDARVDILDSPGE